MEPLNTLTCWRPQKQRFQMVELQCTSRCQSSSKDLFFFLVFALLHSRQKKHVFFWGGIFRWMRRVSFSKTARRICASIGWPMTSLRGCRTCGNLPGPQIGSGSPMILDRLRQAMEAGVKPQKWEKTKIDQRETHFRTKKQM